MSNSYEFTGTIHKILPTNMKNPKYPSREFVIYQHNDQNPQYSDYLKFQVGKDDKCALLDKFRVGEAVKIQANVKGREWTNPTTRDVAYFNTLDAWKIEPVAGASTSGGNSGSAVHDYSSAPSSNIPASGEEPDLPF